MLFLICDLHVGSNERIGISRVQEIHVSYGMCNDDSHFSTGTCGKRKQEIDLRGEDAIWKDSKTCFAIRDGFGFVYLIYRDI